MTDDTTTTGSALPPPGGRIDPVDLQDEMSRSYLDYAMSVIVGRALPDVRDGLKPVHRRVLYAMYDGGYRPDRGYNKCARVVGEVMGNYHPHGDTSIYDALVRLAQPWALRYPFVDGQGNFGSPGNDPAAAMRYCVVGDTRVRTYDDGTVRIADIVPGAVPNTDHDLDLKVLDRGGLPVRASKLFHSGEHETLRLRTREGFELQGTRNHPVLTIGSVGGVPALLWKLLEEMVPGDRVAMARTPHPETGDLPGTLYDAALLAGAFVAEGFVSQHRAGFNNVDEQYFGRVLAAYDSVVGGRRYVYQRVIASGSTIFELDVQDLTALRASMLAGMVGLRSADKRVPEFVWTAPPAVKTLFLRSLFEGDGSVSALPRGSVQISYSTLSDRLAREVQQLLLELGVVSRLCRYEDGEIKVVISNRRDARLFAWNAGFLGAKQDKLSAILEALPGGESSSLSEDYAPFVADFLREHGATRWTERDWLRRHNLDRIERWERDHAKILARVSAEAAQVVTPLVDGRFFYAEVASVEDAGVQPVYSLRVDTDDHAFVTDGFVSHNTECRMAPLAMEMVREIDQDTVDFQPNYDGRSQEPLILPARFPNLLVNGSAGIAVGMATNIPPHNLREVASAVQWYLANPECTREELLEEAISRVSGPDFPTGALIVGRKGIDEAYRTGRGSVTMRSVVEVEELQGRTCLVVTELPYQVNPDNLAVKIADLVRDGKMAGIADLRDETSGRTGQRLVIVLKRDAVAKVVLNNLYKHTELQTNFGCNMVALVDGVPRTLKLDSFIRAWVAHQVQVIQRRTRYRLAEAERRAHVLRGYAKALDQIDAVVALIRRSPSAEEAQAGLMQLLDVDEVQARAILDLQLRRLAALERQTILDDLGKREAEIEEYKAILASEQRQREIIAEELGEIVERYGDERRSRIIPAEGDMSAEDLIPEEDVVVTITRGGYVKRTLSDLYRSQRRGGKGVRGAQLREDDVVDHLFVTTTHHWILFFTNKGRVYRAKAYELPETGRDAKGQHVANLLEFQPDEKIARVLDLRDYEQAEYLVLATRRGFVKKTRLTEYDSNRSGGVIAINFREDDDELIGAELVESSEDLLLVSRKAQAIRFTADDEQLRPMGRATSGVTGMRFRSDDELLSLAVVREGTYIFTVTDGGFAKRSSIEEYRQQGRAGLGIKAAKISEGRGSLVGALVVEEGDEVMAIRSGGGVTRSPVRDVPVKGRDTMGVKFVDLGRGDAIVAIARSAEDDAVLAELDQTGVEDDTTEPAPAGTLAQDDSTSDSTTGSTTDGQMNTDEASGTAQAGSEAAPEDDR